MADPMSLVVADAAARAVEFVGLPEAQLNLAQAVVHLATAPKSNRSALAIWHALEDVQNGFAPEVPLHLRDGHPRQKRRFGEGRDYRYPHDDPRGWVEQRYLAEPPPRRYYRPSEHGAEAAVDVPEPETETDSRRKP
jgi:putative ATPase